MTALQSSWFAGLISQTLWGFPINEIVHIFSISMVAGVLVVGTLGRLRFASQSLPALQAYLLPVFVAGYMVALISGFLFFAAWPDRYLDNSAFWAKLIFVAALPLLYAVSHSNRPVIESKKMALHSALLFVGFGAIVSGRLMAYLAF